MSILDRVMDKAREAIGRSSGDLLATEVAKAIGSLNALAVGSSNEDRIRRVAENLSTALATYEEQNKE